MSAVHLFDVTVDVAQIFLLFAEERLAVFDNDADNDDTQRQDAQSHQRHRRTDGQHHAQHTDHHGDIGDDL